MDLSIIISACGMQRCVAACLRSVTRCPREQIDMECIVVNDASADETAAIVKRYAERDRRMKLVTTDEEGVAGAYNAGIGKASGKYILFLNAADRLCEDAWEQIEAAVLEEYADLIAFSAVTSRKNGKLKAQMLPISDVISTDKREARKLMYADSVLNTCGGKLFKGRIIRDNNIFFQKDFPGEDDFLFVAEYFEHCESYLMTKAMILYCPPKREAVLKDYSINERLDRMQVLYDFHAGAVKRYNDSGLMDCVQRYYFEQLTDLFCEYRKAYHYSKRALEAIYEKGLRNEFAKRLLAGMDERMFSSGMKRYEYRLFRQGNTAKIRRYLTIRGKTD